MIPVYVGYDSRETVAFHVLSHSILAHASEPVSITPLVLRQLAKIFDRPADRLQSTEFSISRFLTPYLSGYRGWSIFMDCDMLFVDDIAKLWALRDDRYAVMVAKHDYAPKDEIKFLSTVQTKYRMKNWSSLILFNNEKCRALTPDYVNRGTGLDLHQFKWLGDDGLIGEFPTYWNHLVGEYAHTLEVGNLHYTIGGPFYDEYKGCDYAKEWFDAKNAMLHCQQRAKD